MFMVALFGKKTMLSGVKFLDDDDKGAPRREDRKRHERHPKRHHKSSRDEYDRKRESSLPKKKHDNGGDVVEPKHPQTKEGEQVGVPRLDEDQNYTSLQREDWMTKPISRKIDAEETAWEDEQPKVCLNVCLSQMFACPFVFACAKLYIGTLICLYKKYVSTCLILFEWCCRNMNKWKIGILCRKQLQRKVQKLLEMEGQVGE